MSNFGRLPATMLGPGIAEDVEYQHQDGYLRHHVVPREDRTVQQHEWIKSANRDRTARFTRQRNVSYEGRLPSKLCEDCRFQETKRLFLELQSHRGFQGTLLNKTSSNGLRNLELALGFKRVYTKADDVTLQRQEYIMDHHLLRDIFPGEQYHQVRSLMQDGLGFTLVGEGIRDFLDRSLDPERWLEENPKKKKIHLVMIVTVANKDYVPKASFRQSKPDVRENLPPEYNYIYSAGTYCPINSRESGRVFVTDEERLRATPVPGKWCNYTKNYDGPPMQLHKDLHEHAYANRLIFSHQSGLNNRGNLVKVDAADYLLVEWIQQVPHLPGPKNNLEEKEDIIKQDRFVRDFVARPHDSIDQGFPRNLWTFIHRRPESQILDLWEEGKPYIDYLNLHEEAWYVRKVPLRKGLTESRPEFNHRTPYLPSPHRAFFDFIYCMPEEQWSKNHRRFGPGKRSHPSMNTTDKCKGGDFKDVDKNVTWSWPYSGHIADLPFYGENFSMELKIFQCADTEEVDTGCCHEWETWAWSRQLYPPRDHGINSPIHWHRRDGSHPIPVESVIRADRLRALPSDCYKVSVTNKIVLLWLQNAIKIDGWRVLLTRERRLAFQHVDTGRWTWNDIRV